MSFQKGKHSLKGRCGHPAARRENSEFNLVSHIYYSSTRLFFAAGCAIRNGRGARSSLLSGKIAAAGTGVKNSTLAELEAGLFFRTKEVNRKDS